MLICRLCYRSAHGKNEWIPRCHQTAARIAPQLGDHRFDFSNIAHMRCPDFDRGLVRRCLERSKVDIIIRRGIRIKHQRDARQIGLNVAEQIDPLADDFRLDE